MKIAIATSGRFHVLDLARELSDLNNDVSFYSYVPPYRTAQFGLKSKSNRFIYEAWPLAVLQRIGPKLWFNKIDKKICEIINATIIKKLSYCDIFIGMSGLTLEASIFAREKFGAQIIIERGSRHINSQAEILKSIQGENTIPEHIINREVRCYEVADRIVVPSRHVANSFIENNIDSKKIFVNPYGVDLKSFHSLSRDFSNNNNSNCCRILFVGQSSLRKGCDLISDVIKREADWQLIHVGSVGDYAFPSTNQFLSIGHVDQRNLIQFYNKADVLVLPSREEGLSLVLIQAIACGLPIVCSPFSGGKDLRNLISHKEAIAVVDPLDGLHLHQEIKKMINKSKVLKNQDFMGESAREYLTWTSYGKRYADFLREMITSKK